ncbi:hypothetical protein [Terrisporobacter sp.]
MPNDDTIKLLKECDAGTKMGIDGIQQVIDKVEDKQLLSILEKYLKDHEKLEHKIQGKLNEFHDSEKEPNPIARAMSWVKINVKLIKGEHDPVIADLMTEGCNMGIKSISRYMNQYPTAMETIKSLCYDLVELEENFEKDLRRFL